jgi:predicted phage terminase large subunit-like protein
MFATLPTNNSKLSLRDRARLEHERRQRARQAKPADKPQIAFPEWLPIVTPNWTWDWPHQKFIYKALQRVTDGECRRLMIFMPPRHTKTETVTVRYATYRMEHNPTMNVILGCYNQHLANRFSRKVKRLAETRFPLSKERNAVEEWETAKGGGFRAVGVGGGITGFGGDLIMIDDPVKNREEAESEIFRNKCWDWFNDDLYTRLEPGASMILTMTRWHEDDLAGRLLKEMEEGGEHWDVVQLPAIAEEGDAMGRKPGEALCPDRYDEEALERIRGRGEYAFEALYQQRPTLRSGSFFKVDKLEFVDAAPADARRCRGWDKAATQNDGDWTAGVKVVKGKDGLFYIEHVERGQWDTATRDSMIRQTAQLDGISVHQKGEQEPGSGGKESAENFIRMLAGFTVTNEKSTANKQERADPFSSQLNAGNVRIVKGDWNKAFIEELRQFPNGKHDDQVDGAALAFNHLNGEGIWVTSNRTIY